MDDLERLSVGVQDVLDADDLRVASVTVNREAMIDVIDAKVSRHSTETVDWETTVRVVGLNNLADATQRSLVLVVLIERVEGAYFSWQAV